MNEDTPRKKIVDSQYEIENAFGAFDVPDSRGQAEQVVGMLKNMLGKTYKVNDKVSVKVPKLVEISVQQSDNNIHVNFHGDKPEAIALGGWVSPTVNGVTINEERMVIGLGGILPDLTVNFK